MRRALFALLLAIGVSGCSDDPTEIVLVVHTDLAVPSAIDAIRIDVLEPDGETKTSTLALDSPARLPGRLGITHTRGALYPVEVTATALRGGVAVVTQRARVGFVPEQSRLLELFLLGVCADTPCAGDTTCEGGACLSIERGALPPWRGRVPTFDAGGSSEAGPRDAGGADGDGAPADGGGDAQPADPCDELRRLPPRPTVTDDPDAGPPIFFAMRALDFGTPLRVPDTCRFRPTPVAHQRTAFELGYDIDGANTSYGTAVECTPEHPDQGPGNDGCGGVDNVLGSLYGAIATFFPCSLAELGDHIEHGRGGFLLWVRGWNGTPNDPRVEVALLPTAYGITPSAIRDGGTLETCPPRGTADAGVDPVPTGEPLRWDGTDTWFVVQPETGDLDGFWDCERNEPYGRDQAAYVVDGLLVSIVNRLVPVRFGPCLALPLEKPVLTARITETELTDGIVQARIPVAAVRAAIATFDIPIGEMRDRLEEIADHNADVYSDCGYSDTICDDESFVFCDALTTGLGFDALRTQFGGVRPSLTFRCD